MSGPAIARRPGGLLLRVLLSGVLLLAIASPARAHSYADPTLATVFDGVQPDVLPTTVVVRVQPSVVDELTVANPTTTPLDVLARGGEAFLRVDASGVWANLASPDWYLTSNPEGGEPPPADVVRAGGRGRPRWARVSRTPAWAEFDPRLHPPVTATPEQRRAGRAAVLTTWRIPLRYGTTAVAATGHVLFTPVRGGFVTAVTNTPDGLTATALQGELPGVLLQVPANRVVVVQGVAGEPFLRFRSGTVEANTASPSWLADQRARGAQVPAATGVHWVRVATAPRFSWLDSRLRYPADLPPPAVLARPTPTVVRHWSVPLLVDGAPHALQGTDTWFPRAAAVALLRDRPNAVGGTSRTALVTGLATGCLVLVLAGAVGWRRYRRT